MFDINRPIGPVSAGAFPLLSRMRLSKVSGLHWNTVAEILTGDRRKGRDKPAKGKARQRAVEQLAGALGIGAAVLEREIEKAKGKENGKSGNGNGRK